MAEDDGDIEYLDEDEDVIQKYVSTVQTLPVIKNVRSVAPTNQRTEPPLLVERRPADKRKIKVEEDDSDYDPNEDLEYLAEERERKKRKTYPKRSQPQSKVLTQLSLPPAPPKKPLNYGLRTYENKLRSLPNLTVKKQPSAPQQVKAVGIPRTVQTNYQDTSMKRVHNVSMPKTPDISMRKKMDIKIPDYDDPICLPVLAIQRDEHDIRKLRNWNNLCLDHYKSSELKSDVGSTVSSSRTIIFRNVRNKNTGKVETTIWGKNTVSNENQSRTTKTFQSILPKYKEKKMLRPYTLASRYQKPVKHTYEAILTKEDQKDSEILVVYKPGDNLSAVYKFIGEQKMDHIDLEKAAEEEKRVLKEVACCKACAPCYQSSWRGIRKRNSDENIKCSICKRSFVSVYNLLTHLKTGHTSRDVRKYKRELSEILATMVEYHYKCRICQQQFASIKLLRKHITSHQGDDAFNCELGHHMAK